MENFYHATVHFHAFSMSDIEFQLGKAIKMKENAGKWLVRGREERRYREIKRKRYIQKDIEK